MGKSLLIVVLLSTLSNLNQAAPLLTENEQIPGMPLGPDHSMVNHLQNSVASLPEDDGMRAATWTPPSEIVVAGNHKLSDQAAEQHGDIDLSHLALFPRPQQPGGPIITSFSEDARDAMRPQDDVLDDDCDSPQLGDSEPMPQKGTHIDMNQIDSTVVVPEQEEETREVLQEQVRRQRNNSTTHNNNTNATRHHTDAITPVSSDFRDGIVEQLPAAPKETVKCSRNTNGNDIPDALDDLGDDCGMPEPEIPCETIGNSTLCDRPPKLYLTAPPLPPAVPMPPKPVAPAGPFQVAVEFPDYGSSVTVVVESTASVLSIVNTAYPEDAIGLDHVSMVRNGGADISTTRQAHQLTPIDNDLKTIIVYLVCVPRARLSDAIVKLPLCEELGVDRLQARVEIPESHSLHLVDVLSTNTVSDVLLSASVAPQAVSQVTYNGMRVSPEFSLDYIHFSNRSALVVYLLPTVIPSREYPTIGSGGGAPTATPAPPNTPATTTGGSGGGGDDSDWPRDPMKQPCVVTIHLEGDFNGILDFPVLIEPHNLGAVLYDATRQRTGKPFSKFTPIFRGMRIEIDTALKPFGFLGTDTIVVQSLA